MTPTRTTTFIDALLRAENHHDITPLVSLFASDAELLNPTLPHPLRGPEGAKEFWTVYLDTFRDIHSEFRQIVEADQAASLEWTSRGTAPDGRPVVYEGVSLLDFAGDRIRRFRAYFDPRTLGAQLGHRAGRAA